MAVWVIEAVVTTSEKEIEEVFETLTLELVNMFSENEYTVRLSEIVPVEERPLYAEDAVLQEDED